MRRPVSRLCSRRARGQGGVALIEVVIAMLIIAFWMLSNAGLQLGALKFQKSAESRLRAITLVSEIAERMEANPRGAQAGHYELGATSSASSASSNCAALSCSPQQLADFDLAQWTAQATAALKLEEMKIDSVAAAGGSTTYQISLSWNEPRGRQRYASSMGTGTTETMTYVATKVVRNVSF
jgi:type IV pilus assembly protein PilV